MNMNTDDLLNSIMEKLNKLDYIKSEDIPNIDLYMDQVTTFMDNKLRENSRYPDEDKIMTKTMINNYAKNNLLPSPEKKKYSKEHMLVLIFIYYFKGILSIGDIQTLLKPITTKYFKTDEKFDIKTIYDEILSIEEIQIESLKQDIEKKYQAASESFKDAPEDDIELLKKFSFICMLGFDMYVKKMLIEKMIDGLKADDANNQKK